MKYDLLYIAFVDLKGEVDSGSGVRPVQMAHAFERLGLKVKTLEGWPNDRKKRKQSVRELMEWLATNTAEVCYIEPPSGPLFVEADRKLIRLIHKKKIPIGLFYRDIYWRYPTNYTGVSGVKMRLIHWMQERDLKLFKENLDLFFFPSKEMAIRADFGRPWVELPPGTVMRHKKEGEPESIQRLREKETLRLFYVGEVLGSSGVDLLLDALTRLNHEKTRMNLTLICRKGEWETFQKNYDTHSLSWLTVVHTQGDGLIPYYEEADIAVIPRKESEYMNFAMPVKLFEYVSQQKPIVVTNCTAMANFVQENGIGWVSEDNPASLCQIFSYILENREEAVTVKTHLRICCEKNTWEERAKKAIGCLKNLPKGTSKESL